MQLYEYPKNDENTLYLSCGIIGSFGLSMSELISHCKAHFGEDISTNDLKITSEYIHTRCIGYDLYDPSDYDCYLVIRKKQ